MQEKGCRAHSSEPGQPGFGEAPEAFNTVDMSLASDELIAAMIDSQVLAITNIDQAVVATPAVRIYDALWLTLPRIMACSVPLEQFVTISV